MAESFEPQAKGLIDWYSERHNRDGERVRRLEIAQLGKVWVDPTILTGIYGWQGAWDGADDPDKPFKYRLYDKDHLQTEGAMTGGDSDTIAFTLLPPFWPDGDIHITGHVVVTGEIQIARLDINHVNGQVTVVF